MSSYKEGDFFILIHNLIFNGRTGHERLQGFLNSIINKELSLKKRSLFYNLITEPRDIIPSIGMSYSPIYKSNISVSQWIIPSLPVEQMICNSFGDNELLIVFSFSRLITVGTLKVNRIKLSRLSYVENRDFLQFCFHGKNPHKLKKIKYFNPDLNISKCWNASSWLGENLVNVLYNKLNNRKNENATENYDIPQIDELNVIEFKF